MDDRYIKNLDTLITKDQQNDLLTKHIGVIGCGGNGGYVIEFLVRLGIKELSIWDGDKFETSNLNRQIYCTMNTLGLNKATATYEQASEINPNIWYNVYDHYFGDTVVDLKNANNCDLIFLCADVNHNWIKQRSMLRTLLKNNIPMIDCAVKIYGVNCQLYNRNNINEFDMYTNIQKQFIDDKTAISQPAFLCSMSGSAGIYMMLQYFNNKECYNFSLDLESK